MRQVALPEPVYAKAVRAAEAKGQSVEEYVLETVQDRLEDDAPLVLTPEQIVIVRRAQEDVRAGRVFTTEQLREKLAASRDEWIKANPQ